MTQIPLFRSTDPSTSRDAAARVPEFRAGHESRIYAALDQILIPILAPDGQTYRDIASSTGLEPVAVARRLVAMERRKLITRRRDEVTGKYLARDGMALWYRAG